MKNGCIIIMAFSFLFTCTSLHAQDTTKTSAMQQIKNSSQQADQQQAKRIQQQSLLNNRPEKLDNIVGAKPEKKKKIKNKRKQ